MAGQLVTGKGWVMRVRVWVQVAAASVLGCGMLLAGCGAGTEYPQCGQGAGRPCVAWRGQVLEIHQLGDSVTPVTYVSERRDRVTGRLMITVREN